MNRLLILVVVLAFGCKKSENRSCWKFRGSETEKKVELNVFDSLDLGPYLNYHLVQDTQSFVLIKGGENVVNLVSATTLNGKLTIENNNKCKFLRNRDNIITVEIHFSQLRDILYEGSGIMTNEGVISSPNLVVTMREASGSIDLNVNCGTFEVSAEPSWGDYKISGTCNKGRLTVKGNAFGDTRGLQVNSLLTVISRSSADLKINADNTGVLKCETRNNGNVYYYGIPNWIDWNDYGTGKLLQGN